VSRCILKRYVKSAAKSFSSSAPTDHGQPLESRLAIVELIGATTTRIGLTVAYALDKRIYEKSIRIKKAKMKLLAIEGDAFHPEWNCTAKPRPKAKELRSSLKVS
jgi:hypothetical protein